MPNWWTVSLIQQIRTRTRWSVSHMKAWGQYHRINHLLGNKPCWTLVVASPSMRRWGYLTPKGWVDNETYRDIKNNGDMPSFLGGVWF